jgi:general secretion pathway protein B
MSFILDALKKSETDRQRQSSAEFTGIPTSPGVQSVPRWLWVVGALLAVNLIVLTGLMLRPDADPLQSSLPADGSAADPAPADDAATLNFEEQVAEARRNRPEQQNRSSVVPPEQQSRSTVVPPEAEPIETASDVIRPNLISQNPSSISTTDIYPSIHEIIANGSINLPELHLDIHVYSENPEERFVFINMSKLREGSQLSEGPVVAEITPDGVVLGHLGQLFLLPRE